ncbi:hypothetical protein JOC85_001278 [Bacillus mesophilus]|uniref:Uncharacterized protein n=1 Tax=Bacillus mesophilus TaxID=1808955 RepID=A0A6M0Q6J2_9BACI|nr:hypothetical protein [Bacillus mesophilus]MBM7660506.1 hypothetical protein [Bacillus mesophilus]NEY71944.1 hypothetical protein [Bacillus mesophilus]
MSVYVYQTFEIKQDQLSEAIKNVRTIQNYRNEHYDHKTEILSPISGEDFQYSFLSIFEGLAEMELQSKKMFEDEEYKELITEFMEENIVQGSLYTQIYRSLPGLKSDSDSE